MPQARSARGCVRGSVRVARAPLKAHSLDVICIQEELPMVAICIVLGVLVFEFAALRWGADSRDGFRDPR